MQPGAEFDVVSLATKVAEQRIADGDTIAIEAVFHLNSQKRLALVVLRANPYGRPETIDVTGVSCTS